MANKPLKSIKFPGLTDTYVVPQVDDTLTITGAAADAKAVGDAIAEIEPGLSDDAKTALLNCFAHVAWVDEHGQDYYDALEDALSGDEFPKITAEINLRGHKVFTSDAIDTLKNYLTVKYYETSESSGMTLSSSQYSLSGTLSEGTNIIIVTYNDMNARFVVSAIAMTVPSEYTRKDYIKPRDAFDNDNPMPIPRSNGSIAINMGLDLDSLSYYAQCYAESAGSAFAGDGCLFGGRTQSGDTRSVAIYVGGAIPWLSCHTHGGSIGTEHALKNAITKDVVHDIALVNRSQSPSFLIADDVVVEVPWQSANQIVTPLYYFVNSTNSDTTQYMRKYLRCGILEIKNLNEETVKYLIPVIRNADNRIGIYDGITGTFYTTSTAKYATVGNSSCAYSVGNW